MNEPTVTITGNLTADVEVRNAGSTQVAGFTVASTPRTKKGDEWVDGDTLFMRVDAWRGLAEAVAGLRKGTKVIVVGRLKQRSFEHDGQKRTVVEMEADEVGVAVKRTATQAQSQPFEPTWGPKSSMPTPDPWATEPAF